MPAPNRLVTTATLIRGQLYTLRHPDNTPQEPKDSLRFQVGVPVIISDKRIVEILEGLYDEVVDGEGEVFEKPRFRIDKNVDPTTLDDPTSASKPQRLSATRKPIKRRRRV